MREHFPSLRDIIPQMERGFGVDRTTLIAIVMAAVTLTGAAVGLLLSHVHERPPAENLKPTKHYGYGV